jgi:hypothetical protein
MDFKKPQPPLWFSLLVAVALALALRWVLGSYSGGPPAGGHAPDVQYGFWFFVVLIASAIWKGLEVAGRITLIALSWSVKALWWFATTTANGLKFVGNAFLVGLKASWEFLRLTYDSVIKPGLVKFWQWFDKFRHWLDATFGPVLEYLKMVRDNVMLFYKTWIRPWLDLIDVARRTLRILSALGLDWARQLDAKLGQLQELIDRPFRLVLGKLNEVINIVNRIVTVDGLIQRVALLRSLERDFVYAWRTAVNPWRRDLTNVDREQVKTNLQGKTLSQITAETKAYMRGEGGPLAPLFDEMLIIWRKQLREP